MTRNLPGGDEENMTNYKTFTFSVFDSREAEAELNQFIQKHKVIQVEKSFFQTGQDAYWSFLVAYLAGSDKKTEKDRAVVDYKEILSESDFNCFAELRQWRKEKAEQAGLPVFSLFTNRQQADMATNRISRQAELSTIQGVGEQKTRDHGAEIAEIINRHYPNSKP